MFEVIPAIDIRGGQCVRLYQGDYGRETVFSADPEAMARQWIDQGAPRLHVVDLDAARDGSSGNAALIERIIASSPVPVQVGGGMRSGEIIRRWLDDAGADRVVTGTFALTSPEAFAEVAAKYGRRVAVTLDVRDGVVATRGWLESSGLPVAQALSRLAGLGARLFIYTDIARDGTLTEPDYAGINALLRQAPIGVRLIASGGVASVNHVQHLARLDLDGVIVGRALYDGRVSLPEAIAAAGRAS